MSPSSSRTSRSTRRWSAAAVAAVAGPVLSAVVALGSATGASADSRSAAAERAGDLGSDLNRDVGFVTTYSGGDWGARVVDTVGGHGLAFNGGTEFDTSIFGYPSNRDGGNKMWACWGTATDSSWWDDRSQIGCNFGPGSSGGPWLWQYDNSTGQGYVRSVMSTVDGSGVNRGPYFDTAVRDALDAANGDW